MWASLHASTTSQDRMPRPFTSTGMSASKPIWLERMHRSRMLEMSHSRIAKRLGHGFLFQLWFNTLGPGARTWFGNRYVGIRRHTFRITWRP